MKQIQLTKLHPHPGNPRLAPHEDVVEQIVAQLNGAMDEAHALIVRPNGDGYEILSGHHRWMAAERAGLETVPCHVREMNDEDAYMALALNNAQRELHALEIGLHALHGSLSQDAYGKAVGLSQDSISLRVKAARVSDTTRVVNLDCWRHLAEVHAAPSWLWPALVVEMLAGAWTVEITRKQVARFKDAAEPPEWADAPAIAIEIVSGDMKAGDIKRFQPTLDKAVATIEKLKEDAERLVTRLISLVKKARPAALSQVINICNGVEAEQRSLIGVRQQADFLRTKREEEVIARTNRLKHSVSLKEWREELADDERQALLNLSPKDVDVGVFNAQENADIEWAQWSWNPVTGCLHDCPYCYAREIANQTRMAAVYPNGFDPTFRPAAVLVPRVMKVPKEAKEDARYRNVFTCSMADLFGRWVPAEWIEAILREMRAAPQWNFLCLTKFPKRMAEFDIPPNTWMGTTVDLQARVPAAEAAFAKVNCEVKWLSIEPMLEPLKFNRLDLFNWIVIGGSSAQPGLVPPTPTWHPPSSWVFDLEAQAIASGVKIYEKSNLWGHEVRNKQGELVRMRTPRRMELPGDLPVHGDSYELPEVFRYLGKAKTINQTAEIA